ncbi:RNA polymerase sigma-70 factor (ECF subfamily) [Salirhabdus euzebyi]|uniref:RNA polymerase sigma-70 factor (ECF subfamily) n=1 Tax=Salirhabdus euzebyi TaxID=394506 RepID=A0A841QAW2_9BACI|nr:sigma-70 family RNA polymerase sigma factor [Salirhabdus euzebyi]MBB6455423.1 RNA polymerase sigma-70 factor (ECF subfamily) [Salirhabdus euzebyi]
MDDKIFNRARKRDEEAFLTLMRLYKDNVYYTGLAYLKNSEKAKEAVQEVTFRAYKNIHKVKKATAVKAWLVRITINYCLDEIKKSKRFQSGNDFTLIESSQSHDVTESLFLTEAIHTLRPKYQMVVIMKYYNDLTVNEIAESLKMPTGTVKTYLSRALTELRNYAERGI